MTGTGPSSRSRRQTSRPDIDRQHQVEHHQVGNGIVAARSARRPSLDRFDFMAVPGEVARDDVAHGRVVIDDEDATHRSRLRAAAWPPTPSKDSVTLHQTSGYARGQVAGPSPRAGSSVDDDSNRRGGRRDGDRRAAERGQSAAVYGEPTDRRRRHRRRRTAFLPSGPAEGRSGPPAWSGSARCCPAASAPRSARSSSGRCSEPRCSS